LLTEAESCSLLLSSVRFFPLLPTPPRGDAVTSSSHPEHGSRWPRSSTPEDRDASQRTSLARRASVRGHRGRTRPLIRSALIHHSPRSRRADARRHDPATTPPRPRLTEPGYSPSLRPPPSALRPSPFAVDSLRSPFGLPAVVCLASLGSPFALRPSPFALRPSPSALRPPPSAFVIRHSSFVIRHSSSPPRREDQLIQPFTQLLRLGIAEDVVQRRHRVRVATGRRDRVVLDRGRNGALTAPPLPPNRTGGFPASGSPVRSWLLHAGSCVPASGLLPG
jgi:hypothetical protein